MIDTAALRRRARRHTRSLLALATLSICSPCLADPRTWIGGTATWDNPNAWAPTGQPVNGDGVIIAQSGASATYSNPANPAAVYADLQIGAADASTATLIQSQNTLNTNRLLIGVVGKGAVNQSGGAMNVLDPLSGLSLGASPGADGAYNLSGSAVLTVAGQCIVGDSGIGAFVHTGGRLVVTPVNSIPGQLVIGSSAGAVGTYSLSGGTVESGALEMSGFGGTATFDHSAGALTLTADLTLGDVIPAPAGLAVYSHTGGGVTAPQLNIQPHATFKQAGGTLRTNQLTINATGGLLDLTNQNMVIDYTGTSPLPTVRGYIKTGYNNGAWTGSGIASTTAAANGGAGAVAYAEASDLLAVTGTNKATWNGQTVDSTSLLLRYTLAGDATMDGVVDFNDLVKLAQNYNVPTGMRWTTGDFTYDQAVDFNDLVKLAQNYNKGLPSAPIPGASPAFEADLARAFALVPEPGVGSGLLLTLPALLRRRVRNAWASPIPLPA